MDADTLSFLRALYSSVQGFITLTAIHPDRRRPTPSRHIPTGDEGALCEALDCLHTTNQAGWGAYLSVATRKADLGRWRRGGKSQLASLPALFVDMDGDPDAGLLALKRCPLAPSCIVASGGGLHSYWLLQEPTADFARADYLLRGLTGYFQSDRTNVAQALRLPGTINTKPNRNGARCHLLDLQPERRYRLADFNRFAPLPRSRPRLHGSPPSWLAEHRRDALADEIAACLRNHYGGFLKSNGWIAALCPCGHHRDAPGAHFGFNPQTGNGFCFGRHGCLSLGALCTLLSIAVPSLG